jgi:hypothetical protein
MAVGRLRMYERVLFHCVKVSCAQIVSFITVIIVFNLHEMNNVKMNVHS